mmetsp:Transcript_110791/g.203100  ORF Transcript_110791/g.203100 Transcript_110791/m.203100 type:complete len:312 (-) Transcript_110791:83-1018(-)
MALQGTPPAKRLKPADDDQEGRTAQKTSKFFSEGVVQSEEEQDLLGGEHNAELDETNESVDNSDESEEEDYLEMMGMARRRWTPNQLRARIRKLLQQTDIKITEFQHMLSVNANSYNRFMNGKYKNQWSAAENQTYDAASRFFLREEKLGKKAIGKVRAKSNSKTGNSEAFPDISTITTDGLTYLTPGETRQELSKMLKQYKTSLAALARFAGVPYQSFCLFYKAGGEFGGVDNQAYRPAADLIEKVRVACKKPKSKKRLGLEAEVAAGRVKRDGQPFLGSNPDGKFLCLPGERPFMARDALGRKVVQFLK